jgi:hypothetical protein
VANDKEQEFPLASQIKTSQTQFFLSQLCRKLPPEILNDLYESSQQSGRKHKCTPLKGSTPKRKRLLSPGTPSSISGSYDTVVAKFKKWRRRLVEISST